MSPSIVIPVVNSSDTATDVTGRVRRLSRVKPLLSSAISLNTDRQTDRQTDTDRPTLANTDRQTDRQIDRHTDTQTNKARTHTQTKPGGSLGGLAR
jgi:hypothetical protein